jgi:formamidopyrimidine-DNA glycosylase
MPELPEVETTRLGLSPHLEGFSFNAIHIHRFDLRWPIPADLVEKIVNQPILSLQRRGKYLILSFKHGYMILHLGMSGSLRLCPINEPKKKHDHIEFFITTKNISHILRFHDPRRFGACLWTAEDYLKHPLIQNLGPEPLSEDFSIDYFFNICQKSSRKIKDLLMDANTVVGIGNIYANEALFQAKIFPSRAANTLTKHDCEKLKAFAQKILTQAIKQGGTTLKDFVSGKGKPGYFQQELNVYGREGLSCKICQTTLQSLPLSRQTVFCPQCQKI